jgi:hypothetical protein
LSVLKKKSPVILFTDEKYFAVDQIQNCRTDRYITKLRVMGIPNHIRIIQKSKHPSHLMVFGLIASNSLKMPPVFYKKGFQMGSKEYLTEILELHVLSWVCQNFPYP